MRATQSICKGSQQLRGPSRRRAQILVPNPRMPTQEFLGCCHLDHRLLCVIIYHYGIAGKLKTTRDDRIMGKRNEVKRYRYAGDPVRRSGYSDQRAGFTGYGLIERESGEPVAVYSDLWHQSLSTSPCISSPRNRFSRMRQHSKVVWPHPAPKLGGPLVIGDDEGSSDRTIKDIRSCLLQFSVGLTDQAMRLQDTSSNQNHIFYWLARGGSGGIKY
jgi:hypothetical protein